MPRPADLTPSRRCLYWTAVAAGAVTAGVAAAQSTAWAVGIATATTVLTALAGLPRRTSPAGRAGQQADPSTGSDP